MIGTRIRQFKILDQNGSGGMATVYRTRDTCTGCIVAPEMMSLGPACDPSLGESSQLADEVNTEAE